MPFHSQSIRPRQSKDQDNNLSYRQSLDYVYLPTKGEISIGEFFFFFFFFGGGGGRGVSSKENKSL